MSLAQYNRDSKSVLMCWHSLFRDRATLDQEDQEYLMKIMRTIKALNGDDRKILVAKYFNLKEDRGSFRASAYSAGELAKQTGKSVATFKNHLARAERHFKTLWEKDDPMTEYLVKGNLGISCTLQEDGSHLVVYENIETGEQLKSEVVEL